jgi:acyl dehydratase
MEAGDVLFEVKLASSGRSRLAAFSRGSQDPNPIHVDETFAKEAGFPAVLQQGPITTAQFARLLDECAGIGRTKVLDIFFMAPVFPDDALILKAEVVEVDDLIRCALTAHKMDGIQTAKGTAELTR